MNLIHHPTSQRWEKRSAHMGLKGGMEDLVTPDAGTSGGNIIADEEGGGYYGGYLRVYHPELDRRDPGKSGPPKAPVSTVGANVIRTSSQESQMPRAVYEPPIDDLGTAPSIYISPQRGHPVANKTFIFEGVNAVPMGPPTSPPFVSSSPVPTGAGLKPQTNDTTKETAMDLGDVYDKIDDIFFDGQLPGGAPYDPWFIPTYLPTTPTPAGPAVNVPAAPSGGATCTTGCAHPMKGYVWNPCANNGAGKWQKKSRRRSKTLLSPSQGAQLSNLLAIAGNGKLAVAWIATHG